MAFITKELLESENSTAHIYMSSYFFMVLSLQSAHLLEN